MIFFLVVDLFNVLMWYFSVGVGQIRNRYRYGGAKSLTFRQIHIAIITLSAPKGGQTPLTTSMGSHGRICPPLNPPLNQNISTITRFHCRMYNTLNILISFAIIL